MENTITTVIVCCCSNDKPRFTPALFKEKKRAFMSGNEEEQKMVQRELRGRIGEGENCYRRRIQDQLRGLKSVPA